MLSLKELALKIGADYRGDDLPLPAFSIDSRSLKAGDLFVAIRAERDGHLFLEDALARGAAAVMVDHAIPGLSVPQIIVKETVYALGQLAKVWRAQFKLPVIGLTGSCGKTTTKEMIARILQEQGRVLAPEGTFNNAYGVPLTLLQLRPEHQFAVIEMGTNSPGEIGYLADIVKPTLALITNIGASHLEKLGSFDQVSEEKSAIFTHLTEQGIAILNLDEPFAESWLSKIGNRHRVTYSLSKPANVFATDLRVTQEGADFILHTPIGNQAIAVPLPGGHIIANAVAAAAVCLAVGISPDKIATGLAKMQIIPHRFQQYRLKEGCILIDDTYNSSVGSVQNAIASLRSFSGRKILVLSSLRELGEQGAHYHREVGKWCHDAHLDGVYWYGDETLIAETIRHCPEARYFATKAELIEILASEVKDHTMILIKGAKYFKMHEIVMALLEEDACAA